MARVGLRKLRAEYVLSQQDLANKAHVSKTTIVGIEAGRSRQEGKNVLAGCGADQRGAVRRSGQRVPDSAIEPCPGARLNENSSGTKLS